MTLPPERISIKRRRGDEPVDHLVIERDRKRRFTDFIFRRLPNEQIDLASNKRQLLPEQSSANVAETSPSSRPGIPTVKATAPGDEKVDLLKYRESQQAQRREKNDGSVEVLLATKTAANKKTSTKTERPNRRFHLTRDLSSALKPHISGGIRKSKWLIRPPLPTFIERHDAANNRSASIGHSTPIDRVLEFNSNEHAISQDGTNVDIDAANSTKTQVPTFVASKTSQIKSGRSIRDDPQTWDLESDQLADELAALAMEMDPQSAIDLVDDMTANTVAQSSAEATKPESAVSLDEFVYETYIRMRLDSAAGTQDAMPPEFGYLVIDEEDSDLWEQYIRDEDEDDEWDEEDEDSNAEDNPRNDYPEDEVSSDDEFGRNVYKYRTNVSDDEEFGDD